MGRTTRYRGNARFRIQPERESRQRLTRPRQPPISADALRLMAALELAADSEHSR